MLDLFQEMTLDEQVRAEALANGYRREAARQTGSTVRGVQGSNAAFYAVGDRIRRIAAELDAEQLVERRGLSGREPSTLIATAKADWPDQFAKVKAFAEAEGLPLGEAWKRVIDDGVASLNGKRR